VDTVVETLIGPLYFRLLITHICHPTALH